MTDAAAQPEETAPGDEQAAIEPTADQIMAECVAIESEGRRWLKGITAFVATRSHDADPSGRVQFAADMAYIAAFDAVARLMVRVRPGE